MTCVVLAAGYATRLYPLTRNTAKPLLDVGGRTIIDRLLDNVATVDAIERVVVVTNERFSGSFEAWRQTRPGQIDIVNDGTTSNETRLGALGDLALAVRAAAVTGPALVAAGDNIFEFAFPDFVAFFERQRCDCIAIHRLDDVDALRRTGVVEIDADDRVVGFAEKPDEPRSTWAAPPLYLFTSETLTRRLPAFLEEHGADAPGAFIPWLLDQTAVAAYHMPGGRWDIGSHASYDAARGHFKEDR